MFELFATAFLVMVLPAWCFLALCLWIDSKGSENKGENKDEK